MEDDHNTKVAQELQIQTYSSDGNGNGSGGGGGGGGGRPSKKAKQKKVPQRGLGVAQLEKIRMEELQKKNAVPILSPQQDSVASTPIQNFHHSNQPPPRSQAEFRTMSLKQMLTHNSGFEVDPAAMQFLPSFPFESNPVWSLPYLGQKAPQFHHQLTSMVNVSTPPMPHYSREPPSNQNCNDNGLFSRQAEKIIGVKRPYPFCLDAPPVPANNYTLCNSGFNNDAGNSTLRELPSCSASNSELNSRKRNKENENFIGHFLTLAPPTSTSSPPSKTKPFSAFLAIPNKDNPESESTSFQDTIEDQVPQLQAFNRFNQQKQPFYYFFPPAADELQIGVSTARTQNVNGAKENVDLNLKLGK
ncbi:protein SPEAR2-like [Arachis stenosperma]|uniref:protein SPEAR2-like n=1 Tax=Arachis stenosperma TaxID=217475 RepID=UPI0025AC9877|nr:protein SPEAR2-like [Arachis stenosperma]